MEPKPTNWKIKLTFCILVVQDWANIEGMVPKSYSWTTCCSFIQKIHKCLNKPNFLCWEHISDCRGGKVLIFHNTDIKFRFPLMTSLSPVLIFQNIAIDHIANISDFSHQSLFCLCLYLIILADILLLAFISNKQWKEGCHLGPICSETGK